MGDSLNGSIAITKMGLVSSIGHDVITSCASFRAGISFGRDMVISDDIQEMIKGHPIGFLTDGFQDTGRLIRLFHGAFQDFMADNDQNPFHVSKDLGVFLALQHMAEEDGSGAASLVMHMESLLDIQLCARDNKNIRGFTHGHAGGIMAIEAAVQAIRNGEYNSCIVGGIASCFIEDVLFNYYETGRLKTENNPIGFMPGEAAAFVLVESDEEAAKQGRTALGFIEGTGTSKEENNRMNQGESHGRGLADAIQTCMVNSKGHDCDVGLIVGDINGEAYRSIEWGSALSRLPESLRSHDTVFWYPCECYGDTEAASPFVALCNVIRGFQRQYIDTHHVLICSSSDSEERGAVHIKSNQT